MWERTCLKCKCTKPIQAFINANEVCIECTDEIYIKIKHHTWKENECNSTLQS